MTVQTQRADVGEIAPASGQLAVTQDAGATWAGIATPGVAKATCFEAAPVFPHSRGQSVGEYALVPRA